jgi:hypothetical protein
MLPVVVEGPDTETQEARELEDAWQAIFEEFGLDAYHRMGKLTQVLDKELEQFEELWRKKMPRKYRKPSPRLLQLMHQEQLVALSGEFDYASEIKKNIDHASALEAVDAQKRMEKDYKDARAKLLEKHTKAQEKMAETIAHERSVLMEKYKKEKNELQVRKRILTWKRERSAQQCFRQTVGPRGPVTCPASTRRRGVTPARKERGRGNRFLLPPLGTPVSNRSNL